MQVNWPEAWHCKLRRSSVILLKRWTLNQSEIGGHIKIEDGTPKVEVICRLESSPKMLDAKKEESNTRRFRNKVTDVKNADGQSESVQETMTGFVQDQVQENMLDSMQGTEQENVQAKVGVKDGMKVEVGREMKVGKEASFKSRLDKVGKEVNVENRRDEAGKELNSKSRLDKVGKEWNYENRLDEVGKVMNFIESEKDKEMKVDNRRSLRWAVGCPGVKERRNGWQCCKRIC